MRQKGSWHMDIVILGGGVIGLTLANLLVKQTDHNVTIVSPRSQEIDRYSALTHASTNVFSYLGIWQHILATNPGVYNKMHLSDDVTKAMINIDAHDFGASQLGYIVNNRLLAEVLFTNLQCTRVEFVDGLATGMVEDAQTISVLVDNARIDADLVLGADGVNSWLRKKLAVSCYNYAYQHSALVATIKLPGDHNNTARQIFYPDGPLAFLPLGERDLCSIVWSTSPQHAEKLMHMSEPAFAEQLNALAISSKRFCFPLRMQHVEQYIGKKWALLGDAAHVIHPLAGQGMNLGLLDAAVLAECLQDVNNANLYKALRIYERVRKSHNWQMIGLMEFCKRLFSINYGILNTARGFGMRAIDRFNPAKTLLAKVGMGVYGELPLSARGYL